MPQNLITKVEYDVMPLAGPMIEIPKSKPEPVRPEAQPQPQPVPAPPPRIAKLYAPAPLPAPKPKPVEVRPTEVPKVEQAAMLPKLDVPDSEPVRPREVKTGVLGDSPAGGGFGDPHGLPGAADPSKRVNIAHVGAFDSDTGSGLGSGTGNGTGVGGYGGKGNAVGSSGFGNGTDIASGKSGGGNGNGVASSGFGNGTDIASGKGDGGPRVVQTNGFQSSEVLAPVSAKAKPAANEPPAATAVAILSKPNPAYTDEARRLGIEGEVLLNVVFLASGQVKVDGVSKGLGHGLDESAIRAAQQIRFKPAMQDGQPVDFPATVHIVFQLAF